METSQNKAFIGFLFLTTLTGGALIMVVEVLGSKVIGPFFGVSLFVWTSLIAVAMIALACGYAVGGSLSDRYGHADYLYALISLAGFAVLCIPMLAPFVIKLCLPLGLRIGAFTCSLLLFGPSLFLMGCISPYVIKIAVREIHNIGRTVGRFYAVSTVGSVIGTVSTGFLLIALFGVKQIFFLVGSTLLVLAAAYFVFFRRKYVALAILAPCCFFLPVEKPVDKIMSNGTRVQVVDKKETHYGSVKIVDYTYKDKHVRDLMIDGLVHSSVDMASGLSTYPYNYILGYYPLQINQKGKSCLVLGLGAGSIPSIYQAQGIETDVLDIDPLIFDVAEKHFGFIANGSSYVEDARYYLNNTQKKYDYLVLDVFSGESMPTHLLSLEAYQLMSTVLTKEGVLAFNMFGSLVKNNYMTVSIVRTLEQVFDHVDIFPLFNPAGESELGNIAVIAYNGNKNTLRKGFFSTVPTHPSVRKTLNEFPLWEWRFPEREESMVLTDNYIPVDFHNAWMSEKIRQMIVENTEWEVLAL